MLQLLLRDSLILFQCRWTHPLKWMELSPYFCISLSRRHLSAIKSLHLLSDFKLKILELFTSAPSSNQMTGKNRSRTLLRILIFGLGNRWKLIWKFAGEVFCLYTISIPGSSCEPGKPLRTAAQCWEKLSVCRPQAWDLLRPLPADCPRRENAARCRMLELPDSPECWRVHWDKDDILRCSTCPGRAQPSHTGQPGG